MCNRTAVALYTGSVVNALTEIGLDQVVGDRPAWINVSRDFVLAGLARALPAERVVLELLEDQPVDETLVASLEDHRAWGFPVALDDFTWDDDRAQTLPYVNVVKVELLGRDPAEVAEDRSNTRAQAFERSALTTAAPLGGRVV